MWLDVAEKKRFSGYQKPAHNSKTKHESMAAIDVSLQKERKKQTNKDRQKERNKERRLQSKEEN